MKKLIYILAGLIVLPVISLVAQTSITSPKISTDPVIYTMDESVTWYFDFGDAPEVTDGEDLYMWIWSPKNPTNTPIKIESRGRKIWSYTLTPTTFFGMTSDEIFAHSDGSFYFLIRDLDGTKLTATLNIVKTDYIKQFVESDKAFTYAPSDFQLGSTLSILFNANKVPNFYPAPYSVHLHSGLNATESGWEVKQEFQAWLPEIREKTMMTHLGNGIYKKDLVPQTYYGVTEEFEMINLPFLVVQFNGTDGWGVLSPDYLITAPGTPEQLPPSFYLQPMRMSLKDMLVITRDNNDRGQRLSYTITGGTKTITGDMAGAMTQQRAFVNLLQEFKGMDLSTIHILVKDQYEIVIYDEDIPLLKVDNPIK